MQLGAFSLSLAVKDIARSLEFYQKLGFKVIHGDQAQNWLILSNGTTSIGLFQGMFEKNMLTCNPGWGLDGAPLDSFEDIRDLQEKLKASGIALDSEADTTNTGPAHAMLTDPDGNPILIDQHR
ncbi:VOC family protein [Pelagibacterium luteolum]|nr:VOC family protein [Pelagibacterium luteolum]